MTTPETIASRFVRLNQIVLGKSNANIPNKYLAHRDGLLDVLFALYEECGADYMRKDKHIAAFVDKFKGLMLDLKSLRVSLKDFEVKKIIGRGHFGEVQVVREKGTGDVYAMKVLRKQETLSQQNVAFYKEERDIMSKSTSSWLTKLQYSFQDSNNLYLVMEFHPGGDMLTLLIKYDYALSEEMCQFYLAELVLAIHSLHSMGYVHRDIKPDNVLIDRTGHIKLADFGSASRLNSNKQVTSSMPAGTPDYVAPEVLAAMNTGPTSSKSYGVECDWWSLGVVTYEMVFGTTPFSNDTVLITYNNIMNFKNSLKLPPEASDVSDSLIDLIKGLLQEAKLRLCYDELISHPFFTDIDWNNIHCTVPPYVPNVTSVDDTSNFDDFEPENRPYFGDLKFKKEFSGKNLPFVGFTYTAPIETPNERLSSIDESGILSPSVSFCESDNYEKKKKISALQSKVSELSSSEQVCKAEINKLKISLEAKERELDKSKSQNITLNHIIEELNAEVQQVKQLLQYERDHRVITEQKAAQLVKCMKTKQRQDALRLKSRSLEYNKGEIEKCTLEVQLEEALQKIDDFVRERAELLEELEATKHSLLKCQRKYSEKDHMVSVLSCEDFDETVDSSHTPASSENKYGMDTQSLRRLVFNLEKRNCLQEHDLEIAATVKKEKDEHIVILQSTIAELQNKVIELEKENSVFKNQPQVHHSIVMTLKRVDSSSVTTENSSTDLNTTTTVSETDDADSDDAFLSTSSNKSSSKTDQEKMAKNLKQENEGLKLKIEMLSSEIIKLKDEIKNKENSYLEFEKLIKEKENALSEAKLDLKISSRKEQQSESITSSLRERNKELREKVKSLEESLNEKIRNEDDLKIQMKKLESDLSEKEQEITEKQKLLEIETAKHEERVKAMQYTCEISKDVTQKFAKSQDHFEEVIKQNMDLLKVKEEKNAEIARLSAQVKQIKTDLTKAQNEAARFQKINSTLKNACIEMEKDLKDLEIIVEARGRTIMVLQEQEAKCKLELKAIEEGASSAESEFEKLENKNKELMQHIEELTNEMENNNDLFEAEMQNVQDQLSHYKRMVKEMEEQNVSMQKDLSLQNKDTKGYTEKILALESQLCEIKEEAARHITQISSLKASNLKLSQALEDALEDNKDIKHSYDDLHNELEGVKANHCHEKVKLQETLAQQTKLIDFLQSKTENMEKKKKPHLARLFGRKENNGPGQYRDVEKLFETEKSKNRRLQDQLNQLQDQLSQARIEVVSMQKEMNNFKNLTANVEVPVSPASRAMHCALTYSPTSTPDSDSPVLVSRELVSKLSKPPGMKHKIPHRFSNVMCMRSTKCCACLDSLHFGRHIAKCQECSVVCHPTCASSLPSTCGLPLGFMQHFKSIVNDCASSDMPENNENRISEGWIKVPKSNKLGWDRRFLRIMDNILYLFENGEEMDPDKALIKLDFNPEVAKIIVTSAVSATELNYAATSDLPFVLKLEYFPHTTCWPKRCLYIMALNFNDKQLWVSTLESLAEENHTEVDSGRKNKLIGKAVWSLKGDKLMDPLCSTVMDSQVLLLGATDGLYVLKITNNTTCSLKTKIDGLTNVYQIAYLKKIGLIIMIQGNERRLTMTQSSVILSTVMKPINNSLISKPLPEIHECHLFSVDDPCNSDIPYICVATSKSILLYQWDTVLKTFCPKKSIEMKEPCSCIHFTTNSIIFGSDRFYELNLSVYTLKKFLDERDSSLAGIIYGASQYRSFPIAIFQVSPFDETPEYLMCFHEMGVFVSGSGQRTRPDNMKWSRLPLSFAYQLPYLFVTHFHSLEVIEIPPTSVKEQGLRSVMAIRSPHYLGPAHVEQSIYLSSTNDKVMEIIMVDGKSIGRSDFDWHKADSESVASYSSAGSGKESTPESDTLDFSFSTSINQSLEDLSGDHTSVSSKTSESTSSQS